MTQWETFNWVLAIDVSNMICKDEFWLLCHSVLRQSWINIWIIISNQGHESRRSKLFVELLFNENFWRHAFRKGIRCYKHKHRELCLECHNFEKQSFISAVLTIAQPQDFLLDPWHLALFCSTSKSCKKTISIIASSIWVCMKTAGWNSFIMCEVCVNSVLISNRNRQAKTIKGWLALHVWLCLWCKWNFHLCRLQFDIQILRRVLMYLLHLGSFTERTRNSINKPTLHLNILSHLFWIFGLCWHMQLNEVASTHLNAVPKESYNQQRLYFVHSYS